MKQTVQSELLLAFTAHGVAAHLEEDVLYLSSTEIRIRSSVEDKATVANGAMVVVHVAVFSNALGQEPLIESFAGFDNTRDAAILEAFAKFMKGTFHVLLESLCGHSCDENQGEWQVWRAPAAAWDVCCGPVVMRATDEGSAIAAQCREFIDGLSALASGFEPHQIHWFRVFICVFQGDIIATEILLDNNHWQDGISLAKTWDWVRPQAYTTVRVFAICMPQAQVGFSEATESTSIPL